jgi:hypothetical protein
MGVIPEEDPQAEEAADYYTVVALNPARMRGRGGKGR